METVPLTHSRTAPTPDGVPRYGAAVDLGTTSIVASLHDLRLGGCLGEATAPNPQVAFGADVLTRVSRALAGDAEPLRAAAVAGIREAVLGVMAAAGVVESGLAEIVVVGNPAMTHLLLGRDTTPLAGVPYRGALVDSVESPAADLGLPGQRLFVGPAASAFVGADAVAGVLATALDTTPLPALLIDLGTNGEIMLATGGAILAASAAAGPAFEGVEISCGMRAGPGAIERVTFAGGSLELGVVGGGTPVGLCGSGLLDAVAAMLDAKVLDASGRLRDVGPLAARVTRSPDGDALSLTDGVALTQHDVRALQLAKGAVATALDMVLEEAGVDPEDVARVFVAGAFGSHVDLRSLVRLGVLPRAWIDRVAFAGDSALAGAQIMLLDPSSRAVATRLARSIRTVPLAIRPGFQERFVARLDFPGSGSDTER